MAAELVVAAAELVVELVVVAAALLLTVVVVAAVQLLVAESFLAQASTVVLSMVASLVETLAASNKLLVKFGFQTKYRNKFLTQLPVNVKFLSSTHTT